MQRHRLETAGRAALLFFLACGVAVSGPQVSAGAGPPDLPLREIWADAQRSAGVLAVEPETVFLGDRAARKKTWSFADAFLRHFVYGNQPNWFPVDSVRRTACASGVGWSYFWHLASGRERDLHAWIDGPPAFASLLGREGVDTVLRPVLDIATCEEVKGARAPCLYSEVTLRQKAFEKWFCGGQKATCRWVLGEDPNSVPQGFSRAEEVCLYGPWVLERVHNWRPEIHPAEIQWVRPRRNVNRWLFLLVPDGSGRFDKEKHFEKVAKGTGPSWRPWSADRPVELWVAFEVPGDGADYLVDLSLKGFTKREEKAVQAALRLPEEGAGLQPLAEPFADVDAMGARWFEESCRCTRGLVALRASIQKSSKRTLVMRLAGRRGAESPLDPELGGVVAPVAAPEEVEAPAPARVRLFAIARQLPSQRRGYVSVHALARFDPWRPPVHSDELGAKDLNKALKGGKSGRRSAFGVERPFRVEWDILATRDADGSEVPVSLEETGPSPSRVHVIPWRGPAANAVVVNGQALVSREDDMLVRLGEVWVAVPPGVRVVGTGRVIYEGPKPIGLEALAPPEGTTGPLHATMVFRLPAVQYGRTQEWDLVRDVLAELDPAGAVARLARLQEEACWPAQPGRCRWDEPPPELRAALADPRRRFWALRELSAGGRPEARFVQLFARALVWDEALGEEERLLLKRLLTRSASPSPVRHGE